MSWRTELVLPNSGGITTLQLAYTNGAAGGGVVGITSTGGGVIVRDNAVAINGTVFGVQNSGGTVKFLDVPDNAAITMQSPQASGSPAYTFDSTNAYTLSYFLALKNATKAIVQLYVTNPGCQLDFFNTATGAAGQSIIHDFTNSRFKLTGGLSPATTNAIDLGDTATPALWRTGYFGTSVQTPALTAAAAGPLTITANAASTWSSSAGALSIDSAAALNLGPTVATSIAIGRVGATATVLGGLGASAYIAVADTNYTVDNASPDFTVEYTSKTASRTVTLPNPSAALAGRMVFVKNNTADTNGLVISSAVNSIDGATTQTSTTARGYFVVMCTATKWLVMSRA